LPPCSFQCFSPQADKSLIATERRSSWNTASIYRADLQCGASQPRSFYTDPIPMPCAVYSQRCEPIFEPAVSAKTLSPDVSYSLSWRIASYFSSTHHQPSRRRTSHPLTSFRGGCLKRGLHSPLFQRGLLMLFCLKSAPAHPITRSENKYHLPKTKRCIFLHTHPHSFLRMYHIPTVIVHA
jgi:hypothetical protein